jgi:glycosyltransferase involved in cell wall biosynthesis
VKALFIGDFSASKVGNHSVIEDLSLRLSSAEVGVLTASNKVGKLSRVADMLTTAWLHRNKVDVAVVDVFSGRAFLWAELVGRILQKKVPIIFVLHGGALPQFARRNPKRVEKLFGMAAKIVAPSRYLAEQLSDYLDEYSLIPNPIDAQSYAFRLRDTPEPKLVWLRSFHHIYNPILAPRVVAKLSEQFPDTSLTMIGGDRGDGALEETQRLAHRLGVADRITFTGAIPKHDVARYLAESDIFLNTTTVDNTPVSVIEALATGLCVVSTAVGGVPYLVEDGTTALLVPSDDDEAMAHAVARLLTQSDLAKSLSLNGRAVAESFDWSIALPAWKKLLGSVA